MTCEPQALIKLMRSWKGSLQVAGRLCLVGCLQHGGKQGSADATALDRGFAPYECQIPMGVAWMEVLEGGKACKQALRRAGEHHLNHSAMTRGRSSYRSVCLWSVRRHPRSNPEKVVTVAGGVDRTTRKKFLENGAKETREGDPAPEGTIEEVRDDRVFGEGACEQSTRPTSVGDTQPADVDVHGVIACAVTRAFPPSRDSPVSRGRSIAHTRRCR